LETGSRFFSAYRKKEEDIPHTRNNWVCYDFKERRIVPTHYTIRTFEGDPGYSHLKSWLIETSADGENWREVAREEDNKKLNGRRFTATFAVAGGGECRFIRLVNIGRNREGDDQLVISAWDIFGSLFEQTDSSDFSDVTSLPFLLRRLSAPFTTFPFPLSTRGGAGGPPPAGRSPCRLLTCGVHSADRPQFIAAGHFGGPLLLPRL
jgi:hypothetical protein